jgi:hypothetical protein
MMVMMVQILGLQVQRGPPQLMLLLLLIMLLVVLL